MKHRLRRGFTLLELLIVMGVISLLSVVLFRSYAYVSEIAFRVQQEHGIMQQVFFVSQTLQNFADRNSIWYQGYQSGVLVDMSGYVDQLWLTGQDGLLHIYGENNVIYVDRDGEKIALSSSGSVKIPSMMFKIVPFRSTDEILDSNKTCEVDGLSWCFHQPGFWVNFEAQSPAYLSGGRWFSSVSLPLQQFFTLSNTK